MPVTLEAWRTYAAEGGDNSPTDADDVAAAQALVRASRYIKARYLSFFCNPSNVDIPAVDEATYIIASIELAHPGFFSKTFTPSEQKVLTEVKGIKWTVTGEGGIFSYSPISDLVHALLLPYYCGPDGIKRGVTVGVLAVG